MRRTGFVFTVLAALVAGVAGSYFQNRLETETVEAQARPRAHDAIRVAVVDLEQVCRQARLFRELKVDWESAQEQIVLQNEKMQADYEARLSDLNRGRLRGDDPDVLLPIQVEIKAMEEAKQAYAEEQRVYLKALLDEYQKEVLSKVMKELERFVDLTGYDIVLQDYTLETEEAGFFSGGVYAQTLLAKPVLYSPNARVAGNEYVTDITEAMIQRVRVMQPRKGKQDNKDD